MVWDGKIRLSTGWNQEHQHTLYPNSLPRFDPTQINVDLHQQYCCHIEILHTAVLLLIRGHISLYAKDISRSWKFSHGIHW